MRYAKEHKQQTKRKILVSAYRLFAAKGFNATSIDEIMRECALTRGGFYAHFGSKSELYREAIELAATQGELSNQMSSRRHVDNGFDWIDSLLAEYFDAKSRCAIKPDAARLGILATDVASDEPKVRTAYATAFKSMREHIQQRVANQSSCSEESTLSMAAMIVGAAAIAQTIDDTALKAKLLASCKDAVKALIGSDRDYAPLSFFWESAHFSQGAVQSSTQQRINPS